MSSKGQVVIPKAIREQLNLQPDSKFDFSLEGRRIIITVLPDIRSMRGFIKTNEVLSDEELEEAIEEAAVAEYEEQVKQGRT